MQVRITTKGYNNIKAAVEFDRIEVFFDTESENISLVFFKDGDIATIASMPLQEIADEVQTLHVSGSFPMVLKGVTAANDEEGRPG